MVTSRPSPTLALPSGRYRVEGRYGLINVRAVREVEVKAGETMQIALEHQASALRLRATGNGPADVSWVIRDETGKLVPLDVKTGDKVLFGKWSGTEVKIDGVDLLIMKESDILGVLGK